MALDSSAELLFRIGADSSDATGNIQRFRGLLSKDLAGIQAEFKQWSTSVFGSMNTVKGALTTGLAVGGAAAVGLGAALFAAAKKAADYAEEIDNGMDVTGLSAEAMSKLRFSAQMVSVEYGTLVKGLTLFVSTIDAARRGSDEQVKAFHRIGISRKDLEDGSKNLEPLLVKVSEAFKKNASATEQAAVARQLFGRGGTELLDFLNLGAEGIARFSRQAEQMGLVLDEKAIRAAKEFKIQLEQLHSRMEGMQLSVGQKWLPAFNALGVVLTATGATMKRIWDRPILALPGMWHKTLFEEVRKAQSEMDAMVSAAMGAGAKGPGFLPPEAKEEAKKAASAFEGFGSILGQVRERLSQFGTEEQQITDATARMGGEIGKAREKLKELQGEGRVTGEVVRREMAALAALPAEISKLAALQLGQIEEQRAKAVIAATQDLQSRLVGFQRETFEGREAAFRRDLDLLRQKLGAEKTLTEENQKLLVEIERSGLHKIAAERAAAYAREFVEMQSHLERMVAERFTTGERLAFEYQKDLERFGAVEQSKSLVLAKTEAERDLIRQQYEINREAATRRYETNLNVLANSSGWRAVFGDVFAQDLRNNEELLREWAESANQAAMLVSVTMESMRGIGARAFQSFAQGMGHNIAMAIVYRQSIGEAMRAALAATLAQIAAESYVRAIYATAYGLLMLAMQNYAAAGKAFASAGMFATVGTAAALGGRAIAPRQEAAGGRGGEGAGAGGGAAGGGQEGAGIGGPRVQIYIQGHIIGQSGIEELTQMINEAVKERDVRLVATQVRQGGVG